MPQTDADAVMGDGIEPTQQQQLELAKKRVSELEAIGDAARDAIPDFNKLLRDANDKRDRLQRARKASRPVHWRLVEAQGQSKTKAAAFDRATARSCDCSPCVYSPRV